MLLFGCLCAYACWRVHVVVCVYFIVVQHGCLYVCVCVFVRVCMFVCVFVCCLFCCLYDKHISGCACVCLLVPFFVFVVVCLVFHFIVYLCVCLLVWLSVCVSV